MKANEAPETIYFTSNENGTYYYTEGIPFEREYIEYICKDAFIEKACDWLEDNASNYIIEHPFSSDVDFEEDKMIEDFKKYMKGE